MFTPAPLPHAADPMYLDATARLDAMRREAAADRLASVARRARRNRG